jgi:hypothetical protein
MSETTWITSTAVGYGAQITASNQIVLGTTSENIFVPGGSVSLNANGRSQLILKGDSNATENSFVLCNGRSGVLSTNIFGIVRESAITTSNIPFQINTSENIGIGYDNNGIPSTSGYKLFVNSGVQVDGTLRLSNNIGGGTASQKNIDFYASTFNMGRIAVNNIGGVGTWTSSMSFFVAIHTTQLYEAIRITGVAENTANCCDVKINGDVEAVSYNAVSDYRVKENVVPLDASFTVDGLNPVTYNLKSSGKQDVGFIAHEVQELYPFLVSGKKDGKDTQSLNYNGFIGILTKEVKELKKKVAEQEAKALEQSAKALEQEAKALEQDQRIQALEKMVFDLINK